MYGRMRDPFGIAWAVVSPAQIGGIALNIILARSSVEETGSSGAVM